MTYSRTLEELAKKNSDGMKIFHVSVGKSPFEEACLQAKGIETIIDQHAIKEAYEMGYKDAKEELEKKGIDFEREQAEALDKITNFVMKASPRANSIVYGMSIKEVIGTFARELAEALYKKGFRIE